MTAASGAPGERSRGSRGPNSITITPIQVGDLLADGARMPVYVHVIDHPEGRVLVDTGMTQLHPAVADMDPRLTPLDEQDFDIAGVDIVVNTHLHFDHCGGNHLFAGTPIYVQRQELEDARTDGRLHHSRMGRRARRDVRACRRCPRTAPRRPARSGARPHARPPERSSSTPARARSSSAATSPCGSASSTSLAPKASDSCARSIRSWSGSRTSASPGEPDATERTATVAARRVARR